MHKYAVPFSVDEISNHSCLLFVLNLHKFAVLDVHIPVAFESLLLSLTFIHTLTVLLAFGEGAFESVTVGIGEFSFPINLVVAEMPLIAEGLPSLGQRQLSIALLLTINEFALVDVAATIFQNAFAMKFASLECALIGFILIDVFALANFLVVKEFSLIDSTVSLLHDTLSFFLSHRKTSLILSVVLEVLQLSKSVKFVLMEAAFVLGYSFQKIFSLAFLHAVLEPSLIAQSIA